MFSDPISLTYLALGDSYSIGEGVADAARWPMQLARALRADGFAIAEPHIIAMTGWSADELAVAMDAVEPLGSWDVVSLLIGVNDQYRGHAVDDYRASFTRLLQRAIALADANPQRVFVLSIPDWGMTPFARAELRSPRRIASELDAYNAAARDVCNAHGVAFVDITEASRELGVQPYMLVEDGLHPSAAMYAEWTRLALPVVRELLAKPGLD
ncbi:MAG: SGNH/GDSL hydrolase family protein [Thermomonas sp.]